MLRQPICYVLLAALALATAGASAAAGSPPRTDEDSTKIVLENDHLKVWFQGKKPTLRMLPGNATTENATGAFTYKFTQLVEYRDLDGNGAPGQGEVVATLNLDRADGWTVNRTTGADVAVINMSLSDEVRVVQAADLPEPPVDLPAAREAQVRLVFTLRGQDAEVDMGPLNATVRATSVKYDLVVDQWPFLDAASNRLALLASVTGGVETGNLTGLGEGSVTGANGAALGSLGWTTTAQGKTDAGAEIPVPVKTSFEAIEGEAATRVAFTYDAPALKSLVHDPTVGLAPAAALGASESLDAAGGLSEVPMPAPLLAVAGVALAALALRRR